MVNVEVVEEMLVVYAIVSDKISLLSWAIDFGSVEKKAVLAEKLSELKADKAEISEMLVAEFEQIDISQITKALNIS